MNMKKLLFFILLTTIFSYKSYSQEVQTNQTNKEILPKELLIEKQPKSIKFKEGALKMEFIEGAKKDKDKSLMVDYGKITKGSNGERAILFINTGKFPIIIQKIDTSCGCTIPKWSKTPILPGKSGEITVKYDTQRVGRFSKNINVFILSGKKGKKEYEIKFQIEGIVLGDKIKEKVLDKK